MYRLANSRLAYSLSNSDVVNKVLLVVIHITLFHCWLRSTLKTILVLANREQREMSSDPLFTNYSYTGVGIKYTVKS